MTIQILAESNPRAAKNHRCMASDFILANSINGYGYSFAELRVIAKAKKSKFRILKGEKYLNQRNKCDGDIYTFRAIPEMHAICLAHDLYEV